MPSGVELGGLGGDEGGGGTCGHFLKNPVIWMYRVGYKSHDGCRVVVADYMLARLTGDVGQQSK